MKIEDNNIYLGDAYKLIKDIPSKSVDLVVTDPPYIFVNGGQGKSELSKRKTIQKGQIKRISKGFDLSILDECLRVLKKINIYIWCSKRQLPLLFEYFKDKNIYFDVLTWIKSNPAPAVNNVYLPDMEFCFFAREEGVRLYGDCSTQKHWWLTPINLADKKLYDHPTIKPLNIIEDLIINSSKENDLVLDPFIGSGTTAVACKELNRRYIGFEIESKYYQIAKDRISGVTQRDKEKGYQQMRLF